MKKILKFCDAPLCTNRIEVEVPDTFGEKLSYAFKQKKSHFCPKHMERITNGKFNDGNPKTNPDLEK